MSSTRKMLTIQGTRQSHLPCRDERDNEFALDRSAAEHPRRSKRRGGFSTVEVWGGRGYPTKSDRMTFLRYLAVGGLNTAFGYLCYAAFVLGWRADLAGGEQLDGAGDRVQLFQLRRSRVRRHVPSAAAPFPRFLRLPWRSEFSLAARPDMGRPGAAVGAGAPLPVLAGVGFVGMRRFVFDRGPTGSLRHLKAGSGET